MSVPTGSVPPAPAAPSSGSPNATASVPMNPPKKRFKFDQRYVAPIFITCILVYADLTTNVLESPWKTGLAILAAIAAEMILGRVYHGSWPHLASAYITGISVGILIRSPQWWPYVACSVISIMSKYVLRWRGRHIWNPSNFGIAAMLVLAPAVVAPLMVQWDNRFWGVLIIWVLGSIIISRLKRFHICLTYAASFVAFAWLRSLITGHSFLAEVAPITGPPYQFFIFFMITDPKTTVQTKKGQVLVAFLIAMVESVIRLFGSYYSIHAPYYALFIVGPIANLVEIWLNARKKVAEAVA
jgi:enediyne biosynthesis protein E5